MARLVEVEPVKPRTVGLCTTRPNAPAITVQEYYRNNCYLTLLDHIIVELESQFDGMNNLTAS